MFFGKPIIVCFPRNSGGKFLINCIGLSNDAVLSDILLVQQQLDNKFNSYDKLKLLLNRISICNDTGTWDDLQLSQCQLFNSTALIDTFTIEEIQKFDGYSFTSILPAEFFLTSATDIVIHSDKFFSVETHGINDAIFYYNLWQDSKIILFDNKFDNFYNFREGIDPARNFKWEIELFNNIPYISWSADDYLIENVFLEKIKNLYNNIGLTDFNEELILTYYRSWLNTIEKDK